MVREVHETAQGVPHVLAVHDDDTVLARRYTGTNRDIIHDEKGLSTGAADYEALVPVLTGLIRQETFHARPYRHPDTAGVCLKILTGTPAADLAGLLCAPY